MGFAVSIAADWLFPSAEPVGYIWEQLRKCGVFDVLCPLYLEPGDLPYLLSEPTEGNSDRLSVPGEAIIPRLPLTSSTATTIAVERVERIYQHAVELHRAPKNISFALFGNVSILTLLDGAVNGVKAFRFLQPDVVVDGRCVAGARTPCVVIAIDLLPYSSPPRIHVGISFLGKVWYPELVADYPTFPPDCVRGSWNLVVNALTERLSRQEAQVVSVDFSGRSGQQLAKLGVRSKLEALQLDTGALRRKI